MSNQQLFEMYAPSGVDADAPRWFVAISGLQEGPLNLRQVMQKAMSGAVDLYDQFWAPGMAAWLDGWSIDEIHDAIAFLYADSKLPLGLKPVWFVTDALLQSHGVDASCVSESQIYSLLIDQKVSPAAQVWRQGYTAWKSLTLVSELAHVVVQANSHMATVARANLAPPPLTLAPAVPALVPPILPTKVFAHPNPTNSVLRPPSRVLIDEERVSPVREFFSLLRSHPLAARGDAQRLQALEDMMVVDFMTGNAYALESKLSALGKMVKGLE